MARVPCTASRNGRHLGPHRNCRLRGRSAREAAGSRRYRAIRSLAVLPLANLSEDPDEEYFVEGMADALRQQLEVISALRVISRTSSTYYRANSKPLREIARQLNADAVVDGSVLRFGKRVRINVELIQTATDTRVWGGSYDRDLKDIFALQTEVAQKIADAIRVTLRPPDRARLARRRAPIRMPTWLIPRAGFSGTGGLKGI